MEIVSHLKSSNPILSRLKMEHTLLSEDISQLSRDLLMLKESIRQKQKSLRNLKTELIQKSIRGPFLSIVLDKKPLVTTINKYPNATTVTLKCLEGGK